MLNIQSTIRIQVSQGSHSDCTQGRWIKGQRCTFDRMGQVERLQWQRLKVTGNKNGTCHCFSHACTKTSKMRQFLQ